METDSEGEEEEPAPPVRDVAEDSRKRKARQQELEAMMDLEDEEPPAKKKTPSPKQSPTPEPPPSTQPPSTTNGGRRRRKRKVSKKTTTKEDGYLVTKLEQVWESFSEDEPEPPPKAKAIVKVKAKKNAVGQGNIMSFFQKNDSCPGEKRYFCIIVSYTGVDVLFLECCLFLRCNASLLKYITNHTMVQSPQTPNSLFCTLVVALLRF